jgi:hypothetical protein
MRRILTALSAALLIGLPGFAQTAPNIPANYQMQNRTTAEFTKIVSMAMGANGVPNIHGVIKGDVYRLIAPVSSSATAGTTVGVTVPVNSIGPVGKSIHLRVFGTTAANANAKTINLLFGTATIALMSAVASNAKDFFYDIDIYSTGANAQQINIAGYANGALLNQVSTTGAQNTKIANVLQINVPTSTGAADVVLKEVTIAADSG